MPRPSGYICRDFGRPGCCSIPDTRYTMLFDDIGEEPIYWCTFCGKQAQAMDKAIKKAFAANPDFAKKLEKAITDEEQQ